MDHVKYMLFLFFIFTSGLIISDCGGDASISSGCTSTRPLDNAVCTSSGATTLSSSFSRFGKARRTVNRYLLNIRIRLL